MELTGRTYIFAAATLILLAGALQLYQAHVEEQGGSMSLFGENASACRNTSVRTENVQLGCQTDRLGQVGHGSITMTSGGAKRVRVGG